MGRSPGAETDSAQASAGSEMVIESPGEGCAYLRRGRGVDPTHADVEDPQGLGMVPLPPGEGGGVLDSHPPTHQTDTRRGGYARAHGRRGTYRSAFVTSRPGLWDPLGAPGVLPSAPVWGQQ